MAPLGTSELLASGRAFCDLSSWRKVEVAGPDAHEWLNDLVSADVAGLVPGRARRSLLLTPTGRIRAEFTVGALDDRLLLVQDPTQPRAIDTLLAPYVLSSAVDVRDRTADLALFAFPGLASPPDVPEVIPVSPSCLGAGVDVVVPAGRRERVSDILRSRFREATEEEREAWRVEAAIPRFPSDGTEEDLPQEAGLADAVSFDKGCYLGQEAVAKVRNLGHPRRVLLPLVADGPATAGDVVVAADGEVGRITSAASLGGRTLVLARVRWEARAATLRTASGVDLAPRD